MLRKHSYQDVAFPNWHRIEGMGMGGTDVYEDSMRRAMSFERGPSQAGLWLERTISMMSGGLKSRVPIP